MCKKKLRLKEKIRLLKKIEDDLPAILYDMLVKNKAANKKKNKLVYNVALPITHKGFAKVKSLVNCCMRISEERRKFKAFRDFKNFIRHNL